MNNLSINNIYDNNNKHFDNDLEKETQEQDSYNNNTLSVISNSISGKKLLQIEEEKEEEQSFSSIIKKNNLLFEEKDISFINLYIHLSDKFEIILMILGTIAALGAGVEAPLMCYLFWDMANDFSSVNTDESQMEMLKSLVECKNEDEVIKLA